MKNAKRTLGEGRWDKIFKREMVALSVADNYDDAKYEWKATGRSLVAGYWNSKTCLGFRASQ